MSATERFEMQFPGYLSIGMTAQQYWEEDATLVRAYREAQRLRDEREDAIAWLHGRYVYEALRDVSPLFHDFVKRTPKEHPYLEKPYMEMAKERKKQEAHEAVKQRGIAHMMAYAEKFNKQFKTRKAGGESA